MQGGKCIRALMLWGISVFSWKKIQFNCNELKRTTVVRDSIKKIEEVRGGEDDLFKGSPYPSPDSLFLGRNLSFVSCFDFNLTGTERASLAVDDDGDAAPEKADAGEEVEDDRTGAGTGRQAGNRGG